MIPGPAAGPIRMSVFLDISISLDGYVAGPGATVDEPLGKGGEQLHEWAIELRSWRESHGREGGKTGQDNDLIAEREARTGAVVMGRQMFGGGEGPWDTETPWQGWWGDDPPFGTPVFVVTHHAREPLTLSGTTFTFVTDGVGSAVEQAREVAGDRDVLIAGGASVGDQALAAGLLDEVHVHVVPVLLGGGVRLFDSLGPDAPRLERARVIDSPGVTHLSYDVRR